MKMKYTLAALAVMSTGANAAITAFADSTTFDYKYEMDVQPYTQDLDSGGGIDWFNTGTPTTSGGFAANTADNQIYRGDFNNGGQGSIWREVVSAGAAADWTFEITVARTNQALAEGTNGWFGVAFANNGESNSAKLELHTSSVVFGGVSYAFDSTIGDGTYNTYRVVHDSADNEYYVWVNDTLLNTDLSTALTGANGTGFDNNIFVGDYTGGIIGDWSIDSIRIDNDALGVVAAVPEPSSTALLGLGGLALILRRRK